MKTQCACGCGGIVVTPGAKYLHAHHWRAKRQSKGIPESKKCEWCSKTYSRASLASPQSNKHWLRRRFCSQDCSDAESARRLSEQTGEKHPGWKGAQASAQAGRMRARRMYPDAQPCEVCGDPKTDRHHKSGDTLDNSPENIAWLCRKHHIRSEDRMSYRRTANKTPEQREREREYQRVYQLRKKGLLPSPPPPKGDPEQLAKQREATRSYRLRKKGLLPPLPPPKTSEQQRAKTREKQRRRRARLKAEELEAKPPTE